MFRLPRRTTQIATLAGLLSLMGTSQPTAADQPRIMSIRFWSWGDVTRVAIETTGDYKIQSDQLDNPPRLYFDLNGLRPDAVIRKKQQVIPVQDKLIKQIRVAETTPGVTRVVFDLDGQVDYTSSQLAYPDRLIVEVRAKGKKANEVPDTRPTVSGAQRLNTDDATPDVSSAVALPTPAPPPAQARVFRLPSALVKSPQKKSVDWSAAGPPPAVPYLVPELSPAVRLVLYGPTDRIRLEPPRPFNASNGKTTVPVHLASSVSSGTHSVATPAKVVSDVTPPAPITLDTTTEGALSQTTAASRDSQGNRSLVRVFGLKIGKVVIDPGHGGKDTGTIGPHGLREKDLVLDVALRLGKLVEARLGSQVVFTRTDDTFIPLEQRTQLANEEKADLFISIHANSSPFPAATGVETYYFNFTTEKAALDLATRENAASASSIHDLNNILQAVLKAKVEESREFAQKVQTSLQTMSVKMNARSRDRGVRKAPFVVLIGATMPSILAEVGFVSNPRDEALLKKPEQRDKIAEALLKGVEQYENSLSHMQIAKAR